jgi:hypothetical protein
MVEERNILVKVTWTGSRARLETEVNEKGLGGKFL